MVTLIVILIGAVAFFRLPIDLMPEITYPTLTVFADYENASAEAYIPDAKKRLLEVYEEAAPGGQIALFYCRPEKNLAEPGNFVVRVIDEYENTVWTGSLENEQPFYYKWNIWYYYKTINVSVAVGQIFTIQVYDVPSAKSYKFKVANNHDFAKERQPNLSLKPAHF